MKLITTISVIAFLAVCSHLAHAQVCTAELCPSTVSVYQYFSSADCSGSSSVEVAENYTKACSLEVTPDYNSSIARQCSTAGYVTTSNWYTNSCSKTSKSVVQSSAIGVCVANSDTSSSILWCNQASVSPNFKAVKLATNTTTFGPINPCNFTSGCANNTGTIRIYTSSGCDSVTQAGPASFLVGGSLLVDTCYSGSLNTKRSSNGFFDQTASDSAYATHDDADYRNYYTTCRDGFYTITYSTGGCGSSSNKLQTITFPTDTCFPLFGQWAKISCPSAASNLIAGPLVLILLAFIALVI